MIMRVMKYITIFSVGLIVSMILYGVLTNDFQKNADPSSYAITISPDNPRKVSVEAKITLQDRILFLGHEGPDPKLFAQFVKNLSASDANGNQLSVEPCSMWWLFACNTWKGWERGQKWRIDGKPGDAITLKYEIAIEHESVNFPGGIDSAAFVTDWGVFLTGRSLFILNGHSRSPFVSSHVSWMEGLFVPLKDSRENIEVNFNLPVNWTATTPWKRTQKSTHTFIARDLVDVAESMLFLGTHHEVATSLGDSEVLWTFGGEGVIEQKQKLSTLSKNLFKYYATVMGGVPVTSENVSLPTVVVIVNSGDLSDGEVIGRHINVLFENGSDLYGLNPKKVGDLDSYSSPILLVAHEFFHLWNGKSMDTLAEGEWLTEGLTEYYALRATIENGLFDESMVMRFLGGHYNEFISDRGYGTLSISNAGEDKQQHHGLIYSGGLFVGLCLDLTIRHETGNRVGLDDVMQTLYNTYAGSGNSYSSSVVRAITEELTGIDLEPFFDAYVHGTVVIPLSDYFNYAGLEANYVDSKLIISKVSNTTSKQEAIYQSIFVNNL